MPDKFDQLIRALDAPKELLIDSTQKELCAVFNIPGLFNIAELRFTPPQKLSFTLSELQTMRHEYSRICGIISYAFECEDVNKFARPVMGRVQLEAANMCRIIDQVLELEDRAILA